MSVTGVSRAFFFPPFRGNYSGCVAWRQRGPQAQLAGNTTQVAVSPFAPTPTFLPASPHQWRDRTQINRNLLKVYPSGMENKVCGRVFSPSLFLLREKRRREHGLCYRRGCLIGLKTSVTQDKRPLTCLFSFLLWFSFFPFLFFVFTNGGNIYSLKH